jgi:hypothetical protein
MRGACARTAILAVVLVLGWSALRVHFLNGGNWTALFCTGVDVPLPPELDAGTYRVIGSAYDGQFYRLLAHDPFLEKNYARYVDAPQFRFRRCLVPFMAWLLAFGQQPWIDGAYIAVEMIFLALGTYWCARLLARHGRSPWWGLVFLALPATLASFDRMLTDGPVAALFAGFLLSCEEERWTRVWLLAMLAGLTRETGLLMAAALAMERALHLDWRRAARFSVCALPALAWYALLAARLPPSPPMHELGIPLWSLVQRLLVFRPYADPIGQLVLRTTDFLAAAGLIASIGIAACWIRNSSPRPGFRRAWQAEACPTICVALYACLALVLGTPVMADPFAFGRVVSPLLLWIMLEAIARRRWAALAPPLAISLNVSLVFVRPAIAIAQILLRH